MKIDLKGTTINPKLAGHNVLFFYMYSNMSTNYNVVAPEHVESHINYNRDFRPGRLMYCEDPDEGFVLLNNGCLKKECLGPYNEKARIFFEKNNPSDEVSISRRFPSTPYN